MAPLIQSLIGLFYPILLVASLHVRAIQTRPYKQARFAASATGAISTIMRSRLTRLKIAQLLYFDNYYTSNKLYYT